MNIRLKIYLTISIGLATLTHILSCTRGYGSNDLRHAYDGAAC